MIPSSAIEMFEEHFSGEPTHVSRAPGRVNLLGEHLDYNGLPVLPMALQREVRVVLRPRNDGLVLLRNIREEFDPVEFEIGPGLDSGPAGHWGNYVMAPANELARRFAIWRGFEGVVTSDVPVASGLSSSSALVTAVGLALAHFNEVEVDPLPFAQVMADAERFTGTRGGAMDHAICMGAETGSAARITFNPLALRHLRIPEDWSFVVADSGVRAEKSGPARKVYNLRRSECEEILGRLGDAAVARGIVDRAPTRFPDLLEALTPVGPVSFAEEVLSGNLLKRFRHVATETERVREGADQLVGADLSGFGTSMDASHGSLRTDYHVSSAELDELTAIAREGGAAGARLTGAGFGGSIVALTDRVSVEEVVRTLAREYYQPRALTDGLRDRVFVAHPGAGASFGSI